MHSDSAVLRGTCGCCVESCPQSSLKTRFLGPQIFSQVRLFNSHPTGAKDKPKRLRAPLSGSTKSTYTVKEPEEATLMPLFVARSPAGASCDGALDGRVFTAEAWIKGVQQITMEVFIACFRLDAGALCVLPRISWLSPEEQVGRRDFKLLIGSVKRITETVSMVQKVRIPSPDLNLPYGSF